MTNEELKQLKAAALAATPGPWDFDTAETPVRIGAFALRHRVALAALTVLLIIAEVVG